MYERGVTHCSYEGEGECDGVSVFPPPSLSLYLSPSLSPSPSPPLSCY